MTIISILPLKSAEHIHDQISSLSFAQNLRFLRGAWVLQKVPWYPDVLNTPHSTFRTALLLPSITRRIDDLLLVKELNARFFEHSILEQPLLAAVSAPAAGMGFDYERLELLGETQYGNRSVLH